MLYSDSDWELARILGDLNDGIIRHAQREDNGIRFGAGEQETVALIKAFGDGPGDGLHGLNQCDGRCYPR